MKYVIRFILLAVIAVLAYLTFNSVYKDVKYAKEVEKMESAVVAKLKILRDGELAYKDANGGFADNFDDLLEFMQNGEMKELIQMGDKDDSTSVYSSKVVMTSVKDKLFPEVDVPNLRYVPFQDTLQFIIAAGEIKKNNVTVPVFEIKDPKPFSKERQKKGEPLKVGSIFDVNYNGNWDK